MFRGGRMSAGVLSSRAPVHRCTRSLPRSWFGFSCLDFSCCSWFLVLPSGPRLGTDSSRCRGALACGSLGLESWLLDLLCRGINHGSVLKIFEVFIPVTVSCIPSAWILFFLLHAATNNWFWYLSLSLAEAKFFVLRKTWHGCFREIELIWPWASGVHLFCLCVFSLGHSSVALS
jgi:hypothetical protein